MCNLFFFQVSAIISRFLLSPEAANSHLIANNINLSERRPAHIRLSSSSPAILGARNHSSENLNSLADAFAHCEEARNVIEKGKSRPRSSILHINEPLRRYIVMHINFYNIV